ncbi:hypothetical protein [Paenibacillus sp. N3.4]|nr:hypothetical protein [Paenibacillus sp. N3.4]
MITCEQCGKANGHGEIGNSWVCHDCKMGEDLTPLQQELEKPMGDE